MTPGSTSHLVKEQGWEAVCLCLPVCRNEGGSHEAQAPCSAEGEPEAQSGRGCSQKDSPLSQGSCCPSRLSQLLMFCPPGGLRSSGPPSCTSSGLVFGCWGAVFG